jgi:hypothetical protein
MRVAWREVSDHESLKSNFLSICGQKTSPTELKGGATDKKQ